MVNISFIYAFLIFIFMILLSCFFDALLRAAVIAARE